MLALLALLAPAVPADPVVLESAHYRLEAWPPFAEGEEYLKVAEALHALLREHFGAEPKVEGKLEVRFWPDFDSYLAGGKADAIPEASLRAGGIYWTGTRRAYFWRQPSASFTRHLFLHELTHQFHYLAVMDNRARCPTWYSEGMAEYFGNHNWDGAALRPGESDVVGLEEDIPRMAEEGRGGAYDLEAVVEGRRPPDKPPSWAAVHFFLDPADPKRLARFRAVEKAMWRGATGKSIVEALLGPDRKATCAAASAHLAALRTTWKIEWIHWDARGKDLVGESPVVSLVRTRAVPAAGTAFVEATLETAGGSAGFVLGFHSTDDFLAVYRRPGGRVEIVKRRPGGWDTLAAADGPPEETRYRVEARLGKDIVVECRGAPVASAEVGEAALAGPVGLFADGGRTTFRDIRLPEGP